MEILYILVGAVLIGFGLVLSLWGVGTIFPRLIRNDIPAGQWLKSFAACIGGFVCAWIGCILARQVAPQITFGLLLAAFFAGVIMRQVFDHSLGATSKREEEKENPTNKNPKEQSKYESDL